MSTTFKLTLFGASFLFSAGRFVRVKVGNNVEWQELDRVDAHQGKLISFERHFDALANQFLSLLILSATFKLTLFWTSRYFLQAAH